MSENNQTQNPNDAGINDPLNMRKTDTGTLKKIEVSAPASHAGDVANQARKTIKLKPLSIKPIAAAHAPHPAASSSPTINLASSAPTAVPSPAPATIPTAVPVSPISHVPASALPGSKQTIKLRPSMSSVAPAVAPTDKTDVKPASAQTIKLTPKTDAEPAPSVKQTIKLVANPSTSQVAAPKASDPTVNLQDTTNKPIITPSSPTISLHPTGGAAPAAQARPMATIKLKPATSAPPPSSHILSPTQPPPTGDISEADTGVIEGATTGTAPVAAPEAPKKIGIKRSHEPTVPPVPTAPAFAQHKEQTKDEPSIIFTVAAVASLIVISYLSFVMFAQFSNHWNGSSISVPGAQKLVK